MPEVAKRLAIATRLLHRQAERSALMATLIRGELTLTAYRELLLNLQTIYRALEEQLWLHRDHPAVATWWQPGLERRFSIALDLARSAGAGPDAALTPDSPLQPAAVSYAEHLHRLGREAPHLLAAHAYVRYLGDLHGGQILGRIVAERIGAPTAFYDFGTPEEVDALIVGVRAGLDRLTLDEAGIQALAAEAEAAFRRHIELFEGLHPGRCGSGA